LVIVADIVMAVPTSAGLAENVSSVALNVAPLLPPHPTTARLVIRMSANAKIKNTLDFMFTPFCIIRLN
jgi:hypothetical protein